MVRIFFHSATILAAIFLSAASCNQYAFCLSDAMIITDPEDAQQRLADYSHEAARLLFDVPEAYRPSAF